MARRQRRKRQERRRQHAKQRGWRTRHSVITGAGVAAGAALGIASPAAGAPLYLTVDRSDDPSGAGTCLDGTENDCSLRQAVSLANGNAGFDYIYFQTGLSGSVLTDAGGGEILVTDQVGVYGNGPDNTTVSAPPSARIFDVDMTTAGDDFNVLGLTLTGGNLNGSGGAIYNNDSDLHVIDSVLTGNTASGAGGAIYDAGNSPSGGNNLFVAFSAIYGNTANTGGGIYSYDYIGVVGGSTLSGNTATSGKGGGAYAKSRGYFYDSTVSGNTAGATGGGIAVGDAALVYNTIVANNTGGALPDVEAPIGVYGVFGLIETPGATVIGGPSNITGVDPQLGGLANNGGNTPTLKPASTSPVVDKGYSSVYYDQRFFARTVDNPNVANVANGTDIGAVELTLAEGPQAPPAAPAPTPVSTFNLKKAIRKCKRKFPKGPKRKRCIRKAKARARGAATSGLRAPAGIRWRDAADHAFRLRR